MAFGIGQQGWKGRTMDGKEENKVDITGAKWLLCSLLQVTVNDLMSSSNRPGKQYVYDNAMYFVLSSYCEDICQDLGISYKRYRDYCLSI